jgi:signal transduction histidine kinase
LVTAFLIVVLVPVVGTGLYGNWITSRVLQARALDSATADLRQRADQIQQYLADVRADLIFLSESRVARAAIEAGPAARQAVLEQLQADFAHYADTHRNVFQLRWIDATGQEVIRVDASPQGVRITPPEQLQNKADRYYFSAAMRLPKGAVYVSPIDLNREFGRLDTPYKPTLRYATPVFDADGAAAGIFILNMHAEPILAIATSQDDEGLLSLVDMQGYYLAHPDASRTWGGPSDLNTGASAARDYPEAWAAISSTLRGAFLSPPRDAFEALVSEVLPLGSMDSSRRVIVHQQLRLFDDDAPRWVLIRDVPYAKVFASVWQFRITAVVILASAVVTALGMAALLSRQLAAPIVALTGRVRDFAMRSPAARIGSAASPSLNTRDEVQALSASFEEMAATLDRYLQQLSLLNRAGHQVSSQLARADTLAAAARAARQLLPAECCVISVPTARAEIVRQVDGDARWERHTRDGDTQVLLARLKDEDDWIAARLQGEPSGYMLSAPLRIGDRLGAIQLFGAAPWLVGTDSGHALATLATSIAIALENAELYEDLALRRAELQTLVQRLITSQEEERKLIAFDIHDGLIQMLVAARLQLRNAEADLGVDARRAEAELRAGLDQLSCAIVEARRLIEGLRPATLDDFGLVEAVCQLADNMREACGCHVTFTARPSDLSVPPIVEITAFRIVQEAITNAHKYSGTDRLRVQLALGENELAIEVQDWGRGFDLDTLPESRGVGLIGMRERARLLGGDCEIVTAPGAGTLIRATLRWMPEPKAAPEMTLS